MAAEAAVGAPQVVDPFGRHMRVRWNEGAAATPHGQLVIFAGLLATAGVFKRWLSDFPLQYRIGNARTSATCWARCCQACWPDTDAVRASPRCEATGWPRRQWA